MKNPSWRHWQEIYWTDEFAILYEWPGVYQVRLVDEEGKPVSVGRVLDTDADGLLVIGESDNVARRLKQFDRASNGQGYAHSTGERMFLMRFLTSFQKSIYKNGRIQFRCMRLKDKAEAEASEEKLLKSYFKRFGELPPLNNNLPSKYYLDWRQV